MAFYLVKANAREDKLDELRDWLDSGEISRMKPFGQTLQHSLDHARVMENGMVVWEEEDYCHPPLAEERTAVLDKYFTDIRVEKVREGEGWDRIKEIPLLWDDDL